jgi:hypothetical protein
MIAVNVFSIVMDEASRRKSCLLALYPLGRGAMLSLHRPPSSRSAVELLAHLLEPFFTMRQSSLSTWDNPWAPPNNISRWMYASWSPWSTPKLAKPMQWPKIHYSYICHSTHHKTKFKLHFNRNLVHIYDKNS